MDIDFDPLFQYQGAIGNYSMDWKGITKLHKQVEELHTESRVASGSYMAENNNS